MIHIDPWKQYPSYEAGLQWTLDMIRFCYSLNSEVFYEIGTEESIRQFTHDEIDKLLHDLSRNLTPQQFERIKYCVIQSGTSLKANTNTGCYDRQRLSAMIGVVKKHGMLSKEHNGDYLPIELIREKFSLGLDSINIAPEFGQIETKIYLKKIKQNNPELLEQFWKICYDSGKWRKWVDGSFDAVSQKEQLINICGHYVFSTQDFINTIKPNFPDIDEEVKRTIKGKLKELHNG